MEKDRLAELRAQIDEIDQKLIELLNQRTQCVIEIGQIKTREEGSERVSAFRPEREAQILQQIRDLNEGPLSDAQVELLFREVISMSISFQQPISVAYLGPVGTYSHSATIKQFGRSTTVRPQPSIHDVFNQVETDSVNYGVVPVENSTEGAVNQTLDCFIDSNLKVCAEVNLPIHHALMAQKGVETDSIQKVYSHEQSLAQCRNWLREHLADVPTQAVASNSEAARLSSLEDNTAAIAGELAADQYQLNLLYTNIEDQASNATRFFVLGKQDVSPSGSDKTSLLVNTPNRSGALVEVLSPFQRHGISLSRVVTRPARSGNWSYVFFIDFDGHAQEESVATVLEEVRSVAYDLKILGSYPRAFDN
ncbi:MAG: prephenate dehydratase [Gammaproteobacteria bacterium]|nr:prephenate dehydratase [Gammaproteobacteria bacterium]